MVCLHWYQALDDGPAFERNQLDNWLDTCAQVTLSGAEGDAYRSGEWHDPETGASCTIDLGEPPIEADHLHPPKAYDRWREVSLSITIPLAGPHWLCVEALQWIETLVTAFPDLKILDTEDTRQDYGDGPGAWHRPRLLASWEKLHHAQQLGRTDQHRMNRLASVCLWRYRRERARGREQYPDLFWPKALVLCDQADGSARSAVLLPQPMTAMALPPVELVVIGEPSSSVVLPAQVLSGLGGEPLPVAQAQHLPAHDTIAELCNHAQALPVNRFKALDDRDWID